MANNQKSGDGSTLIQADKVTINNSSVVLYSIEEVAKQLMGSVFVELPEETKTLISTNQKSYFQVLSELLVKLIKQNEDLKKAIDDPDFQFVSKTASISASRSSSTDLRKNLASLLIQRLNISGDDFKRIVYNEAIATISKLTTDQLKIITLCFLLRYTTHSQIISWETYRNCLEQHLKPFLDFKNTNAEFQHIEYTSCGSIRIGSWSGLKIHKENYSFLFLNLVEKGEIDALNLSDPIKQQVLSLDQKEDKYLMRFLNKSALKNFLKDKNVDEEISKKLASVYEGGIKSDQEIKNKIIQETSFGNQLVEVWEKSNIKNLSLTSVGIAIAATHLEQVTGDKVDISIWIN